MQGSIVPRVSIGMPVYNDAPFVGLAIEAVLAQSFTDFELIISDNASTDGTSEICETYAMRDKRVRYVRQERNLGAVWNFRNVLEQSGGEYFAWAGGHDVMDASFLSECCSVLDEQRDVALVYPSLHLIDRDGAPLTSSVSDEIDTCADSVSQRVRRIITELVTCHMLYGMFRRELLLRCRHGILCRGPDHVLLMELSLYGPIARVPRVLFHLRENRGPDAEGPTYADYMRGQLIRLDPDVFNHGPLRPHWRWGWEHVKGLLAADVPVTRKVRLMPVVIHAFWRRWRPYLLDEVFNPLTDMDRAPLKA
jgi:glycosyltransferase involved in cell wall biosynthesis